MTSSNDTPQGRLLDGRYRIGEPVARGGMATVFRALDTRLDRVVAVKIMHDGLGDDAEFTERFVREARSAAKLNHPNVVAVFDQGEDHGTVYLVMELVEGRTLRDLMRHEAPMDPRRALALMEQILLALSAAHEARIVHRDVKPENVLLTPDGRVKVADFGLARAVTSVTSGEVSTSAGALIGTVSYLAPEIVLARGSDARSDVYACGAVLYEMLTGFKPHAGETPIQIAYRHVHEDVPPPSRRVRVPPYVDALVARATARDRDRRSADARVLLRQVRQVRHALDRGLADDPELTADLALHEGPAPTSDAGTGEPTAVVHPRPAPPDDPDTVDGPSEPATLSTPSRKRRLGLMWLTAVLLLAVLAAAGGFYYGVMRYSTTPELTGETEKSARSIAQDRGLDLEVAGEEFSETARAGTVIASDPGGGEDILDGGTVGVTLSKGKERYDVPAVAGKTQDKATDLLTDRNLGVGEVQPRYHEKVESGDVIRGSIKPGKRVKAGTDVDLFVSKGRRPIDVSSYVGESGREARSALEGAGFTVDLTRKHSRQVPRGTVISQSPDSGSAYRGDEIALVVSRGPARVTVPDVTMQPVEDATKALEAEGLEVEVEEDDLSIGAGIVRSQSPGGDERVPRGTTVTLSVV